MGRIEVEPEITEAIDRAKHAARFLNQKAGYRSLEWALASFFALNTGGLLAALNGLEHLARPGAVAATFLVGVLAMLGCAVTMSLSIDALKARIRAIEGDLKADQLAETTVDGLQSRVDLLFSVFTIPGLLALVSVGSFLCGAGLFVASFKRHDIANDRRCLAIQHDMLMAHPRKPDGPALFQAFGCRPQGEGSVMVLPTKEEFAALKRRR